MIVDRYFTIPSVRAAEIKVKGSKFIAHAAPVSTAADAEAFLAMVSKQYFDATHHCFAYRLGVMPGSVSRYSDDGEPSGTAGRPIFQSIVTRDVTDVMVIVTRYFGGTKLGTGGLARAYGDAAAEVLNQCEIEQRYLYGRVTIGFPYEETNTIMRLIQGSLGKVVESSYDATTILTADIPLGGIEDLKTKVTDMTRGRAVVQIL